MAEHDSSSGLASRRHTALDPGPEDPYGPHPAWPSGVRLDTGVEPDRVVDTHCCFCGQQCGIRLKVKDEQVIGFEPRYDFPFNRGMLCPKGIKRYLQGAHPDRLLSALERDESAPGDSGHFRTRAPSNALPIRCVASRRSMVETRWPSSLGQV